MPIRNHYLSAQLYKFLERTILPLMEKIVKSPNQLTLLGAGMALVVPLGFYVNPVIGLSLMILSGFSDMMDGVMAKAHHKETPFGALLDSSLDRVSDLCFLIGFWILFLGTGREIPAAFLTVFACLSTFMISYVKARAEGLGYKIEKGLMERVARILYLLLLALVTVFFKGFAETVLWIGLSVYCVMTVMTVFQRLIEAHGQFRKADYHT